MGKGRKKVEILKVEDQRKRRVTFSKRRRGLFIKATHLCEVGFRAVIVVFSSTGKPHSFGHPNAESVAAEFIKSITPVTNKPKKEKKEEETFDPEAQERALELAVLRIHELNARIDSMALNELQEVEISMEEMRKMILDELDRILDEKPLSLC